MSDIAWDRFRARRPDDPRPAAGILSSTASEHQCLAGLHHVIWPAHRPGRLIGTSWPLTSQSNSTRTAAAAASHPAPEAPSPTPPDRRGVSARPRRASSDDHAGDSTMRRTAPALTRFPSEYSRIEMPSRTGERGYLDFTIIRGTYRRVPRNTLRNTEKSWWLPPRLAALSEVVK
jgi:hypothetical protein